MDVTKILPLVYCPNAREYGSLGKLLARFWFFRRETPQVKG